MTDFKLVSPYEPTGDQPEAIRQLVEGIEYGDKHQTLLGVTGSGKTFTIANVIAQTRRPTLVLSHNKTLAAQLYNEFQAFFPENAVEYFVSYYDYYQPEAYIASTDTYIEKDLAINQDLDKLRLSSTMSLMSGRRDIIVVSSVSCLYGLGNPDDFFGGVIKVKVGQKMTSTSFLRQLQDSQYSRNEVTFDRGNFRVKGDTIDVFVAYEDFAYRFIFFGDEIESIETIDPTSADTLSEQQEATLFPANLFITPKDKVHDAIRHIQDDLVREAQAFRDDGKEIEAQRLEQRVTYDMEMIKEIGYCPGIENYSRYFDGRNEGDRPYCLLDYFPKDFLLVIDESHVTVPQIHAMYGGDRSRKESLVDFGFRLRSARDNRPLKFEEFEQMTNQVIYVSATPADYELRLSGGVVIEQVVRPTGLLDPAIEVRPSLNQIDDLMGEINKRIALNERTLVTTLTKRMAE
ncbi:MAG: DEAD/DEAH box helicase family protein, partial [Bacteroidales bacterium]|nr:DEAD/DEAH box helicase family protein [Bacteroidales bacterium]